MLKRILLSGLFVLGIMTHNPVYANDMNNQTIAASVVSLTKNHAPNLPKCNPELLLITEKCMVEIPDQVFLDVDCPKEYNYERCFLILAPVGVSGIAPNTKKDKTNK